MSVDTQYEQKYFWSVQPENNKETNWAMMNLYLGKYQENVNITKKKLDV